MKSISKNNLNFFENNNHNDDIETISPRSNIYYNNVEKIKLLLDRGYDPNIITNGNTLLNEAILHGNLDIVILLLSRTSNPYVKNIDNKDSFTTIREEIIRHKIMKKLLEKKEQDIFYDIEINHRKNNNICDILELANENISDAIEKINFKINNLYCIKEQLENYK